jgi:hypothetical protein
MHDTKSSSNCRSSTPLRPELCGAAGRDKPVDKWESINVWEGTGCHHHDCPCLMLSERHYYNEGKMYEMVGVTLQQHLQ